MDINKFDDISQIGFGYRPREIYASNPNSSRGRLFNEGTSPTRTPFQRDRDRIIHSNAFRRLKHKTQVFIADEGDHYRTRLTHTIEVSQIARALARALRLDEDLAEAIALVHDFGHTPFGHAGEDALNEAMLPFGGFDHNAQGLRIVTKLEHRYAEFDGLNLTWETLEGLVKHNGPLIGPYANHKAVPKDILDYNTVQDLELNCFASLEAQCAAIADDIAYNAHDIDDGIRSNLLNLNQLTEVPLINSIIKTIKDKYPNLDMIRIGYEVVRRQITLMVEDVIRQTQHNLQQIHPKTINDIHRAKTTIVCFSKEMAKHEKQLKRFLFDNLYYHEQVLIRRRSSERVVSELFSAYMNNPQQMPEEWQQKSINLVDGELAHLISDFLSGMTDHYALREHRRLFDQMHDLA